MCRGIRLFFTALVLLCSAAAVAVQPTRDEIQDSRRWVAARLTKRSSEPLPFSFVYGGKPSGELLNSWKMDRQSKVLDKDRTQWILTYSDPETGLEVRCEAVEYADYPAVEWVVYLENKGQNNTPIIENLKALDIFVARDKAGEFALHYSKGSNCGITDFQPLTERLGPDSKFKIFSNGMSSSEYLPFFNLESTGGGIIAGLGWSAPWSAEFVRDKDQSVAVHASADPVHLTLHPGEHIRTPRILLMFWKGERLRSQNIWRRLLLAHYCPRVDGKVIQAPLTDGNWGLATEEEQIAKINWWGDNNLPMEGYWIDAGWSGEAGLKMGEWGIGAGNRIPRPDLYPNGMRPVSDAARRQGMKFLLWVWPHTVRKDAEVGLEHPDWIVPGDGLDHGNPVVNQWMIDRYSKMIGDFGIDIFRQDGHIVCPADSGPDRQGLSIIRYEEGFYDFWDALLARHPSLMIDNCAAGGRKQDIETIKRSISLWRSDYQVDIKFDVVGMQGQTYGISSWIPLSGGCTSKVDPYSFRSGYSPALTLNWHIWDRKIDDKGFDFKLARRMLNEYLSIRPYFYGDYYPLTGYSLEKDVWMAWQFDRPEQGDGMVQVFRRENSPYELAHFKLHGLDNMAKYEIKDLDTNKTTRSSGRDLMEKGLPVKISDKPAALIVVYSKVRG